MPSFRHEFLIDLIRQDPRSLVTLLQTATGFSPPPFQDLRTGEADLTQLVPAEYRADLMLVFSSDGNPVYAKVVEVQLGKDPSKKRSWPLYWAAERARLGCPVGILVLALGEDVAAWARQAIDDGNEGGGSLRPMVLGPSEIPWITDPDLAEQAPELAMISLLGHAKERGVETVAQVALSSVGKLQGERRKLYYDVIVLVLHDACRQGILEKTVMDALLEKYRDKLQGLYEIGLADGEVRGEARGEARFLLRLLDKRGIEVPRDIAERVLACQDQGLLERWLDRALSAQTADEVFGDS